MRHLRSFALLLLAAASACGGSPAASPGVAAVAIELATPLPAVPAPPPPPLAPLRLPELAPAAPLLEIASSYGEARRLLSRQRFVAGHRFGIVNSMRGAFALDERGVHGPIAAPAGERVAAAMPVGKDRGVYVVTDEGRGFYADSLEDALAGKYGTRRADAVKPVAFDAAEDVVAIADARALFVSLDAGRAFKRLEVPEDHSIAEVHARADGVVVLVVRDTYSNARSLLISKSAGALMPSVYAVDHADRVGGVISTAYGCEAALTADGSNWWAPEWRRTPACSPAVKRKPGGAEQASKPAALPATRARDHFGRREYEIPRLELVRAPRPRPPAKQPTPTLPATPKSAPPGQRASGAAPNTGFASLFGRGEGGGRGVLHEAPSCSGATCLRLAAFPEPVQGRFDLWAFDHLRCAPGEVIEDPPGSGFRSCAPGAIATRAPSLAIVDYSTNSVRTASLPEACHFDRLLQSKSLMLVSCEHASGVSLELVGPGGTTSTLTRSFGGSEARLVDVADDGTFVLAQGKQGFGVRDPSKAGEDSVRLLDAGLLLARPLRAGHALVAKSGGERGERLELGVDAPGAGYRALLPAIDLVGENAIGLEIQVDATLVLVLHPTRRLVHRYRYDEVDPDPPRRMRVMIDGSLEPLEPAASGASPDGAAPRAR